MNKTGKIKLILASGFIICFIIVSLSTGVSVVQGDPFSELHDKLTGISSEEKESLDKLFALVQEIEEVEREEKEGAQSLELLNGEVKSLQTMIEAEEAAYKKNRDILEQVLKSYQRQGPGSYLEIILKSKDMASFIRSLNVLKDITHNTGSLLEQLDKSRETLAIKKVELTGKLEAMEKKQAQIKELLLAKLKLKSQIEEYIASLGEQREHYSEQLANIQKAWDDLKPLFSKTAKEITNLAKNGELPMDRLKVAFEFPNIRVSIDEKTFNEIILGYPHLPKMEFSFNKDITEIRMPDNRLILTGTFVIVEGHTIKFEAEAGSFYGLPLEKSSFEALFSQGYLLLDLSTLMDGNTLSKVEIKEKQLDFVIKPVLFR